MRAIKGLVAFMSLLLILGLMLLGYGLFSQAGKAVKAEQPVAAAPQAVAQPAAGQPSAPLRYGELAVSLPSGARFEEMAVSGGRVIMLYALPGGSQRLVVFDPASGEVSGQLTLSSQP